MRIIRTTNARGTGGLMLGLVVTAFLLLPEEAIAQCAMCRSVFASEEGQQLAAAFRSGILFLLAAPFVAFGVVATLAIRSRPSGGQHEHRSEPFTS